MSSIIASSILLRLEEAIRVSGPVAMTTRDKKRNATAYRGTLVNTAKRGGGEDEQYGDGKCHDSCTERGWG